MKTISHEIAIIIVDVGLWQRHLQCQLLVGQQHVGRDLSCQLGQSVPGHLPHHGRAGQSVSDPAVDAFDVWVESGASHRARSDSGDRLLIVRVQLRRSVFFFFHKCPDFC